MEQFGFQRGDAQPNKLSAIFPRKMPPMLNRIKKINFQIFIYWVMVDYIYNFRRHTWISNSTLVRSRVSKWSCPSKRCPISKRVVFMFLVQNDDRCSETNEKSIFWFLQFIYFLSYLTIWYKKNDHANRYATFWNRFLSSWVFLCNF